MVFTFRVVRCDTGNVDHLRDEESTMRISYYVFMLMNLLSDMI